MEDTTALSSSYEADILLENARRAKLRVVGFAVDETLRSVFYAISFLPTVLLWTYFRGAHPATLLLFLIPGFYVAGLLFLTLLVLVKRTLIGSLDTDQVVTINTPLGKRFYFASMLNNMMLLSPFKTMVSTVSPAASYYYRGMGARMAPSVFISSGARILDPWFTEIQDNATSGADALILGHAGEGRTIILGSTFIGEGAIIGARSVLLPDVRIGRHARVGAGAVVVRGTVIPDGETWAGVPARSISCRVETAI